MFHEMAVAAGLVCAKTITAYMQEGAPVFGEVPATGLYEGQYSGPDKTVGQVLQAAKWSKPAMKAKSKGEANPLVDEEVLERTEAEVKKAKLQARTPRRRLTPSSAASSGRRHGG